VNALTESVNAARPSKATAAENDRQLPSSSGSRSVIERISRRTSLIRSDPMTSVSVAAIMLAAGISPPTRPSKVSSDRQGGFPGVPANARESGYYE